MKKNTLRQRAFGIILLPLAVWGCGQQNQKPEEPQATAQTEPAITANKAGEPTLVGSYLGVVILPGSSDEATEPDWNAKPLISSTQSKGPLGTYSAKPGAEVVIEGNQISLKPVFPLYDGRNGKHRDLFLAWNENALGDTIIDATFDHRQADSMNRSYITPQRNFARYDRERGMWYFSLIKALRSEELDSSASVTHCVSLDLVLKSGTRIQVDVILRLLGRPPEIKIEALHPKRRNSLSAVESLKLLPSGLPIAYSSFNNPSARPLRVWLRAKSLIQLETTLETSQFHKREHDPPSQDSNFVRTKAPLILQSAKVKNSKDTIEFKSSKWQALDMPAHSRFDVEWIVVPATGTPVIPMPESRTYTIDWNTPRDIEVTVPYTGGGRDGGGGHDRTEHRTVFDPHYQQVTESSSIAGINLLGQIEVQAWVSDPSLNAQDIDKLFSHFGEGPDAKQKVGLVNPIQPVKIAIQETLGRFDTSWPLTSTQGIYALR